MNVTLDGFLSGPGCELDWHFNTWSTEMAEALCDQLEKADTLLFGRVTYLAMATYWTSRAMDYSCPTEDRAYVDMMNRYKKIVFSNTLAATHWNNSVIATNPVIEEVPLIKQQEGGSIMVYGSGRLVSSLIKHNLADEFHLWLHPVTIGCGKPLFTNIQKHFRLVSTQTFRSGVVLLIYRSCK
jgi:dihydrofolate reductase